MLKKFLIIVTSFFIYSCDNNNNDDLILSCNDLNIISELDDFNLKDLNPNSNTFGEFIYLNYFIDSVRLFYFSDNPNWALCQSRFGSLNSLYINDFNSNGNLHIIGVSEIGDTEEDIVNMIEGKVLPWVIDSNSDNVWENWNITNRDLIFLDKSGNFVLRISLTESYNKDYIVDIISCLLNSD